MADSFSKKEKQKRKAQKKKEKQARKEARKAEEKPSSFDEMIAYVNERGEIVDTPPDETAKKPEINAEDIELGIPKKERLPDDHFYSGKVSFFNEGKGYGFIQDRDSTNSYFVHINNCQAQIAENDKVEFQIEKGEKGMVAVKVKKV